MRFLPIIVTTVFVSWSAMAADVNGTWSGEVELANGQKLPFVAVLTQEGTVVTGKLEGINGAPDVQITNGKVEGDLVTFSGIRIIQDAPVRFDYYGVQAGQNIQFTIHRVGAEGPNALLHSLTVLME